MMQALEIPVMPDEMWSLVVELEVRRVAAAADVTAAWMLEAVAELGSLQAEPKEAIRPALVGGMHH